MIQTRKKLSKQLLIIAFLVINSIIAFSQESWEEKRQKYKQALKTADFQTALDMAVQAKNTAYEKYGKQHKNYAISLNDLGLLLRHLGKYNEARPLYEEALSIKKNLYGVKHPNYATSLNNLAGLLVELDQYNEAEPKYNEAIEIYEKSLGTGHYNYINSKFSLGKLYHKKGNFSKAEQLYRETIPKKKEILGEAHPDYSNSLSNLASLLRTIGNYQESMKLYNEALQLKANVFGAEHPYYIATLTNLASLYTDMKEYDEAEPLYLEALELQGKLLGKGHPDYSLTLNSLAGLYNNIGEYDKAEPLFKEAMDIRKEMLGDNNPKYAKSLDDMANLYFSKNNFEKAEQLLLKALQIRTNTIGKKHPDYATTVKNLALLYLEQSRFSEAAPYFEELTSLRYSQVQDNFAYLSNKEKEKYWNMFKKEFDMYYTFALKYYSKKPSLTAEAYNNHLLTKGILFSSNVQVRDNILKSPNKALIKKYHRWLNLKQELGKLYLLSSEERVQKVASIDEMEDEANLLEKELSIESDVFNKERRSRKVTWKDIQGQLSNNEATIEFVAFNFYQDKHFTDDKFYMALIIDDTCKYPHLVEIGTEDDISVMLESNLSNSNISDYILEKSVSKDLYNTLWKPVSEFLDNKQTIYISVAGIINKISIGSLIDPGNNYLLEKFNLHFINSSRNLVIKEKAKIDVQKALIYGGIDYDVEPSKMREAAIQYNEKLLGSKIDSTMLSVSHSKDKWIQTWRFLEGTNTEATELQLLMEDNGWDARLLSGHKANEESFKALSGKSPGVMHIASHGFFFEEQSIPAPIDFFNKARKNGDDIVNPMYRSGIILAGANHVWKGNTAPRGVEDGILTSYEVANTNLSRTKLVVLSACETGLGDIKTGEGVYGLQRAFQLAGVNSLIMSLWTVPDKETIELMKKFYSYWFETGDEYAAFQKAQLEMSEKHDPFYWAAFVFIE